jgi:hypothetical protein
MNLVSLLVVVIVICLLFWAMTTLTTAFGLDARIRAVILVLFVVIAVLWLLGGVVDLPRLRVGGAP